MNRRNESEGLRSDRSKQKKAPPPHSAPKRPTHWSGVADWYDRLVGDEGSEYQREVIIPGVMRMLGIKDRSERTAMRVLDLACGQGVLCRKLTNAGCQVVGIDAA